MEAVLLSLLPSGKRLYLYSINAMRTLHPAWFRDDLERLFELLANGAIRPRVAERISFEEVAEAHRRLEAGGLDGRLVLCPDVPPRGDRLPSQRKAVANSPGNGRHLALECRLEILCAQARA